MDIERNFVEYFPVDVSLSILERLTDLRDLIRASVVSRSWRLFVIRNGLCKELCVRKYLPVSSISGVVEENEEAVAAFRIQENNELAHKIYSSLLKSLKEPVNRLTQCVTAVVGASSTQRHPF